MYCVAKTLHRSARLPVEDGPSSWALCVDAAWTCWSPLLVYPASKVSAARPRKERGDVPLSGRDGCPDLLVVVGSGDLARYLVFGESSARGYDPLALTVLLGQGLVLLADRGEDVFHLFVAEAKILP
jgi:hypothetical protein